MTPGPAGRIAADWIAAAATRAVCGAMTAAGHRVYFVGGCVRNTLLGRPVSDIDLATDALPEATMAAVRAAGLKAVPTGIAHGTVTVIAEGQPFEITTFRQDVATDGRRATVAYTRRIEDDAARRDFTMNALYATPEGAVIDPVATAQVSGVRRGSSLRSFASMSRASAIFCSAVMAVTACEALQTEE